MLTINFSTQSAAYLPGPELIEVDPSTGHPRTPRQQIDNLPEWYDDTIGLQVAWSTVSEHVVLWILSQVRHGQILPDDVRLVWHGLDNVTGERREVQLRIDAEHGELIDRCPGGFYRERAELLWD